MRLSAQFLARLCRLPKQEFKTQKFLIRTAGAVRYLVFLYVFPIMGACCAQIKGFTLGRRELVLVRPNVKHFI